jgi:hypothetical protein
VLPTALVVGIFPGRALAADLERAPASISNCPESEAVWSTVVKLVPAAATQLLAARPKVDIVDFGERYRIRVRSDGRVLERAYSDPARGCDRRARFAAEFIVLALLPPQMSVEAKDAAGPEPSGSPGEAGKTASGPQAQRSSPPPPPPPAEAERPSKNGQALRAPVVRIEASGVGEASPPVLGAPGILMWGADLRVRIGAGRFGGMAGVGYLPRVEFDAGDFRAAVTRVPAIAGVWTRLFDGPFRLDASAAVTGAFERYEGVSPHSPSVATRLAPGVEAGVTASTRALGGLGPFLRATFAWVPLSHEVIAVPQGNVATTPSLWLGASIGMSLEL